MADNYNDSCDGGTRKAPNVFRRGADDGWRMGLLMSAAFLCGVYSAQVPLLAYIAIVLVLAVPFVAYRWLWRDWRRWPATRFFSAAWMQGICFFFFGSLILAAVMVVFMRFVQPDFIADSVRKAIEVYNSIPDPRAGDMAHTLQQMLDKHLLPSAVSLGVSMIWTVTFTGSILSMFLTAIIRLTNRNK